MNKLIGLLEKVNRIYSKYDEMARVSGENFNIFSVMGMETDEVKTHSAFIAELLNPQGLHGQGDVFLKLFVEMLKNKVKEQNSKTINVSLKTGQSQSFVEYSVGPVNGDRGGRIDILVQDTDGKAIVIENKIYAQDQNLQLVRYHNAYPKALLLYLTLNGDEPSASSKGELNKDEGFFILSYRNDILDWMNQCHEKSVNQPRLRETIAQYISLIKILTGQSMSDQANRKIKILILKQEPELLDHIHLLIENVIDIRNEVHTCVFNNKELNQRKTLAHCNGFYLIRNIIEEDKDGIAISYDLAKSENEGHDKGLISKDCYNQLEELLKQKIPKEITPKFEDYHLFWFTPSLFEKGKLLNSMSFSTVVKIYKSKKDILLKEIKSVDESVLKALNDLCKSDCVCDQTIRKQN